MTRLCIASVILAGLCAVSFVAQAEEPKPAVTPVSWELQVKTTVPQRITADGGRGTKTYWYILYTVVNNTGEDVPFHPDIVRANEIDTETPEDQAGKNPQAASSLTIDPAIVGAHVNLFKAIQTRHAKTHPLLVEPVKAIGTLRQGADNAITSVAIFPDLDPRVNRFTIYFGGLSGERISRPNPLYDAKKAAEAKARGAAENDPALQKVFVMQKTLAMPYTMPGDLNTRRFATPALGKMEWVMR